MSASHLSFVIVVDHCAFWLGLIVTLLWTELQLASHGIVLLYSVCFISSLTTEHVQSLLHSFVLSPGFACFNVHASVKYNELIYIFLRNIY